MGSSLLRLFLFALSACSAVQHVSATQSSSFSVQSQRNHDRLYSSIATKENVIDTQFKHREELLLASTRGGALTSQTTTAILGCLVMAVIEKVVKKSLAALDIKFPAMLGGCIALFVSLLVTEKISPSAASSAFDFLKPGADLVAKWFSMLFVPGLVLLPLSPPIGNNLEIAKAIFVCVIGFVYTASTSAFSVLGVRIAQGKVSKATAIVRTKANTSKKVVKAAAAPKPYSAETVKIFTVASIVTGLLSIFATRTSQSFAKPVETLFLCCYTVASYVWGARLPDAYVKLVHPLVTASVMVLVIVNALSFATGVDKLDILRAYKTGSFAPMKIGSGDIFLYLCGTGVISFAVSMYSRRALIFSNLPVLLTAMLVSSVGSLFSTAAFVRLIALGGKASASSILVRLSILARNVTTALSMAITAMLGGDISLAAAFVCLTGVLGGTYGKPLMNALGITDPITRGLGIGSSSQGLGVAAIVDEPDAFPFAAISMVLTALSATALVSIPAFKEALIKVATGVGTPF